MADDKCELIEKCQFFSGMLPNMPDYAELLKDLYCLDGFSDCARFTVFRRFGDGAVPADLYPNEVFRARSLMDKLSKKNSDS